MATPKFSKFIRPEAGRLGAITDRDLVVGPYGVLTMALYSTTLYAGGWFGSVGGATRIVRILVSLGFRVYLKAFDTFNATYGAIGGVIIAMLWMYISGLAILIGAG